SPLALEVFREIGLADRIVGLRHARIARWDVHYEGRRHSRRELSAFSSRFPFVVVIPAGDVLELIAQKARELPEFELRAEAELVQLLTENGVVTGVEFRDEDGTHALRSELVVGADGAASTVRSLAGIELARDRSPEALQVLQVE